MELFAIAEGASFAAGQRARAVAAPARPLARLPGDAVAARGTSGGTFTRPSVERAFGAESAFGAEGAPRRAAAPRDGNGGEIDSVASSLAAGYKAAGR